MLINSYEFEYRAKDLRSMYNTKRHLNRKQQQRKNLCDDIVVTALYLRLNTGLFNFEPLSKIQLKKAYNRNLIVQVFSELGLNVTRYTCEYGRTIVHFEDASDSTK